MMSCLTDCDILIDEFVLESSEGIETAIDSVLLLEQKRDQEAIDHVFRIVHTIKGTAGMLNLNMLSEFVHSFENVCDDIRSGERIVDKQSANGLLKCLDFVQEKLTSIGISHNDDGDYSEGKGLLKALQDNSNARKGVCESSLSEVPLVTGAKLSVIDLGKNGGNRQVAPSSMDELRRLARNKKSCKVLIVDADFKARNKLYSLFSDFMDCYVAKDGSEAIQAVTESYIGSSQEPFSIILMGIRMPIIDGLQAAKAIRALENSKGAGFTHSGSSLFIVASEADYKTRKKGIHECGADDCLLTPMDSDELARLIIQHVFLAPVFHRDSLEKKCA